jgi:hypothetical protein
VLVKGLGCSEEETRAGHPGWEITMTTFEYLAVLISIIVGLGITHLLGGLARFIHRPNRYKFYWIHLLWAWYVFVYLLHFWWFELWFTSVEEWTPTLYAFLILYAIFLYLLAVVVLPPDSSEGVDFREYFFHKKIWFFGILLLTFLVDIPDTLIKGREITWHWYGVPLVLIAILTRNTKYHGAIAIFFSSMITIGLLTFGRG